MPQYVWFLPRRTEANRGMQVVGFFFHITGTPCTATLTFGKTIHVYDYKREKREIFFSPSFFSGLSHFPAHCRIYLWEKRVTFMTAGRNLSPPHPPPPHPPKKTALETLWRTFSSSYNTDHNFGTRALLLLREIKASFPPRRGRLLFSRIAGLDCKNARNKSSLLLAQTQQRATQYKYNKEKGTMQPQKKSHGKEEKAKKKHHVLQRNYINASEE